MEAKELRSFLKNLSNEDFRYLEIQMSLAKDARKMITTFNLSKERFCELVKISEKEHQSFINGGFNYDVRKMAIMHNVWAELRTNEAKKEADTILTGLAK